MVPPHELKNRTFSKSIRGYNTVEVDEHIDFIIEKYTELYRENDELERKLRTALSQLDGYKNEEESIRSALINAQKASSRIINDANERADVILRSAKNNCDRLLSDFRREVKEERDRLYKLRHMVSDFRQALFEEYQKHITQIQNIAPDVDDNGEWDVPDDMYVRKVVDNIKKDMEKAASEPEIKLPGGIEPGAGDNKTKPLGIADKSKIPAASDNDKPADIPLTDKAQPGEPAVPALLSENAMPGGKSDDSSAPTAEAAPENTASDTSGSENIETDYLDKTVPPAFAEEEPVSSEELEYADEEFNTDETYDSDGDTKTFVIPDSIKAKAEEPSMTIERSEMKTSKPAGVRDSINELNKAFAADDGLGLEADEADMEFLQMLQRASATSGEGETVSDDAKTADSAKSQNSVPANKAEYNLKDRKKRSRPLSITEEFDLVYDNKTPKRDK